MNCQTCLELRRLNLNSTFGKINVEMTQYTCHDCGLTSSSLPATVPFVGLRSITYNYVDASTQTESSYDANNLYPSAIYVDCESFVSQEEEEECPENDEDDERPHSSYCPCDGDWVKCCDNIMNYPNEEECWDDDIEEL